MRSNQDTLESRMQGNLARPVWGWGPGEIPGPTPLFIGSHEAGPRAAILYTVVASAARHSLDVWAYLRDVLERLAIGAVDLSDLLPDAWAAAHPESIRTYRAHEREAQAAAKRARRDRRRALERAKAKRR